MFHIYKTWTWTSWGGRTGPGFQRSRLCPRSRAVLLLHRRASEKINVRYIYTIWAEIMICRVIINLQEEQLGHNHSVLINRIRANERWMSSSTARGSRGWRSNNADCEIGDTNGVRGEPPTNEHRLVTSSADNRKNGELTQVVIIMQSALIVQRLGASPCASTSKPSPAPGPTVSFGHFSRAGPASRAGINHGSLRIAQPAESRRSLQKCNGCSGDPRAWAHCICFMIHEQLHCIA